LTYAWLCSEPKEITASSFEALEQEVLAGFGRPRFRTLRIATSEMRELIRSVVSTPMREAEATIAARIRARRATEAPGTVGSLEQRRALYPLINPIERAAGFAHDDTPQAKLDKFDALLAQTFRPQQDAALLAELLSLPNDYPALEPSIAAMHTKLPRRPKYCELRVRAHARWNW
jgi:hypothetical protein